MRDIKISINGMGCQACVDRVQKALQATAGVEVKQVGIGEAVVRIDPAQADEKAVSQAIADAGYEPAEVGSENA